ncbi:MAG: YkgJ family cysteine cluster protein [Acidobacteria bacterium]|nr:YkgJ family cysteine cluster protein [Acidobacteriota bacterium]
MEKAELVQITRKRSIPEDEFYPAINRMYELVWEQLLPPQIETDLLSSRVAKSIVTPPDAEIPDCVECGVCCASLLCVGVRPGEEPDRALTWSVRKSDDDGEWEVDLYVRRDEETLACAQLEGTLGEHATCRIYETRPKMCREFEAGSDRCHALRRAYGIEPFLSLDEMMSARMKLDERDRTPTSPEIITRVAIERSEHERELCIRVSLAGGEERTIHSFDPAAETWRQFEFEGIKLATAEALIAERSALYGQSDRPPAHPKT